MLPKVPSGLNADLTKFLRELRKDSYMNGLGISLGEVDGLSVVKKFGHSDNIGTSFVPICVGEIYQTPTTAKSLELVSTDSTDNQAGVGARKINIQGLDANWELQEVQASMHATDGTTAEAVPGTWTRVFRMCVCETGTYATSTAGSHAGTITLRESGAGATWATFEVHGSFPLAQSQIGSYTVPKGKVAYIGNIHIEVNSSKEVDVMGFQRTDADTVSAPYTAMRTFVVWTEITDTESIRDHTWYGPFTGAADIGFMARRTSAGTSALSVNFEIILADA